jgi:hypothetical protein
VPSTSADRGSDLITAGAASHLLAEWAIERLGPGRVSFGDPGARPAATSPARQSAPGVNFHLVEVCADTGEVGFLVTTDSAAVLVDLTLATIGHPTIDLELGLPPARSWPALGMRARPVGYLRVRLAWPQPAWRGFRRAGRRD